MTETRKAIWLSLGRSFGWAFSISLAFTLLFSGTKIAPGVIATVFALPIGLFMGTIGQFGIPKIHHPSFLLTLIARTGAYALGFVTSFAVSLSTIALLDGTKPWSPEVLRTTGAILTSGPLLITFAVSLLLVFVLRGFHEISRKLGPGNLWNWVSGKYHSPREEERIFMFLDLRGSTTLAEQLGNLKFSALVRDFFVDLTRPVVETLGEVSHYIGDEAVLTWRMERGIRNANCIRCFFLMEQTIRAREEYYRQKYGLVPTFKAGLHCGLVVATEVGVLKSEIVFHGDVLNTSARIQGLCDTLGSPLLISTDLAHRLDLTPFRTQDFGPRELKGKEMPVELTGIYESDNGRPVQG